MEAIPYTLFSAGGYHLDGLHIHLPLILLGFYIRYALQSRRAQWIWLGLLALAAVGCEMLWAQPSNIIGNRIVACMLCIPVIDFSIGTAIIGIPRAVIRLFRWITADEAEER